MAVFKCKMCGGTIEFSEGATVGICDSCGTKQTLPRINDEKIANLYDRANHFRRNNEYDKAMSLYEKILEENKNDSEAYWSIILCRYGIEYVEDPSTHKRVPTVNRAQFGSVVADKDYKSALSYCDVAQKAIYEAEAKAIDDIQKGILEISQKEEPFDVFICYKETDNNGRRTQDSVLATELYHELTKEGFKVFFSRITLEDKLGTAYEPYIFAALNSSKVMVVLGTKPEYFNAVWVKNEWSRYLSLIKSGEKKVLIPAYRDMDPYDLPEEFSHLQAQDMSKLGFMQDLTRGIKKIVSVEAPKETVKETVVVNANNANVAPLLERAFLFLEDGKWQDANIYCEKVLDIDPKNAEAYLGKLMAELQVNSRKKLADCPKPFDNRDNYNKVLRFGDDKLEAEMRGYITHINERNENARLTGIYNNALNAMNTANTEVGFKAISNEFKSISGYKDSDEKAKECLEKAEVARIEEETERKRKAEEKRIAAEKKKARTKKLAMIITPILIVFIIILNSVILPASNYKKALALMDSGNYKLAYKLLNDLSYKDSNDKASECLFLIQKSNLSDVKKGDTIKFGFYEQDNDTSNGKEEIEWRVLAKEDNRILVISEYAIDCKQYNTGYEDVTWETCTLRKWLNNDFLNEAFNTTEQTIISETTVTADANPKYSTNPSNATTDKVFLLSITEAVEYFSTYEDRKCVPTAYAIEQGAYTSSDYTKGGKATCWWWLRSPGGSQSSAASVDDVGSVSYRGLQVHADDDCVRPALWINLDS